jgi:phage recombination protein Bet
VTSTALDLNHATPAAALAIQPGQPAWDAMQLAALDQLGLKDASDGDRAVFLHVCQRTGLDPFARQIYMIGRNEKKSEKRNGQWVDTYTKKWTIQTGIDGHRVNRARAERKAGVRGTLSRAIFYDYDGNEHKVWVQPRPPAACEITYTVRDANGETSYTSVLRYSEYVQLKDGNPIAQWATKPAHMLEKCTEADVYRKAFPQDFSGIYLDDAMPQDTPPADGTPDGRPRGRVTAGEVLDRGDAAAQDEPKTSPRSTPRRKTAAAGDNTRSQRAGGDQTPRTAADENGADPDSAAAGAAPSRVEQPLPPLPGEDHPGSVSPAQLTKLHTVLTKLGFNGEDREHKLIIAEVITGHTPLTGPEPGRSSKNLSLNEARKLIDTLDGFDGDRDKLIAYMAEREQAGDGGE